MRSPVILQSSTISKVHALLIASHNSQVLKTMKTGNNLPLVHVLHSVLFLLFEIKVWIVTWCCCKQDRINITVFSELLLPETLLVPLNKLRFFFLLMLFLLDLPASSPISTSFKTSWLLVSRNWYLLKVCIVFNYDNIHAGKRWNQSQGYVGCPYFWLAAEFLPLSFLPLSVTNSTGVGGFKSEA